MDIGVYLSGREFEKIVLGIHSKEIESRVYHYFRTKSSRSNDIEMVKGLQGRFKNFNPKEPPTEAGKMLYQFVKSNLESKGEHLRLYVSVGTPLDYKHGIDCFFELKYPKFYSIATIDLTTNPNKETSGSNFILRFEDIKEDDRCRKIAERIANRLRPRNAD